jgi:outer membrane protein TolC
LRRRWLEALRELITETGWNTVSAIDDRLSSLEANLVDLNTAVNAIEAAIAAGVVTQAELDRVDAASTAVAAASASLNAAIPAP